MGALTSRRLSKELAKAAREGRVDVVSQLSTHFTGDVYTLGEALYRACEYGHLNVVTWLVEHTVLRDDGERLGYALMEACRHGQWNIAKWLLANTQVNVIKAAHFRGDNSIIHWVISYDADNSRLLIRLGMTELCRLVYVCGKNINVQDNYIGFTPLHYASMNNDLNSAGALLLAGADETITNDNGHTPEQEALWWGRVKVLPLLDVSSKWKLLVRSHRLRRRTAVRVMMTLVKWKVQQTRSMWTRAIMTLHTIMTLIIPEDTLVRDENKLISDEDTQVTDKDTLISGGGNDEIHNRCWLKIRDYMFTVACCYNIHSFSMNELRTM
jgi:hypothetical protein